MAAADPEPKCTRYREIEVAGEPREMGRQWGEAAREEVRGFAAAALDLVRKTTPVSRQQALQVARRSGELAERYAPHLMDELRGAAEGAGVSLDGLLLLQVRNQLPGPAPQACTSFSVVATQPHASRHLVGQNWDSDPQLDDYTIVLTRRPTGKPALMNVTQAGLIAYIGLNAAGLGVCLNTLPTPSRGIGVPHYFTVRSIYESHSLDEAAEAVRRAERAIGANIMLATPAGPANLEVTTDQVCILRDAERLTHTNHCLDPRLAHHNDAFPELIQSRPRKSRIDQLLARGTDRTSLEAALRDHEGYPRSICRHANDDPQHGFWTTVFSVLLDVTAGRMYLSRGNPCQRPYEPYDLH